MSKDGKVGWLEFGVKTSIGKILCRFFGHTEAGYGGRCKRCLFLLPIQKKVVVTEGIWGHWHYHLSHSNCQTLAFCGKPVMPSFLPLNAWGVKTSLNEKYCEECEKVHEKEEGACT